MICGVHFVLRGDPKWGIGMSTLGIRGTGEDMQQTFLYNPIWYLAECAENGLHGPHLGTV